MDRAGSYSWEPVRHAQANRWNGETHFWFACRQETSPVGVVGLQPTQAPAPQVDSGT